MSILRVVSDLTQKGWARAGDLLPASLYQALLADLIAREAKGSLRPATVGRLGTSQLNSKIRGDSILWLEKEGAKPGELLFLKHLEILRAELAQKVLLPIQNVEAHFAVYPPGGYYQKHLDQFASSDARQITFVFYLNPAWDPSCGGLLRVFKEGFDNEVELELVPEMGEGILFLSGSIYHEVTPAVATRRTVTGWFRRSL